MTQELSDVWNSKWRTGRRIVHNIYVDDKIAGQFHNPEHAQAAACAVNSFKSLSDTVGRLQEFIRSNGEAKRKAQEEVRSLLLRVNELETEVAVLSETLAAQVTISRKAMEAMSSAIIALGEVRAAVTELQQKGEANAQRAIQSGD
jgi:hypothetical protein